MSVLRLRALPICLLAAGVLATAQEPPAPESRDIRVLSIQVDSLLRRETGSRLELDEVALGTTRFTRPHNKVHWNSSVKDNRLVSIIVEPVGDENDTTAPLTAALLVTLSAVETLEDGLRMTQLLKEAQQADGKPRMVSLKNGIKLIRLQAEKEPPKYHIALASAKGE